jgi:hypothetical protein
MARTKPDAYQPGQVPPYAVARRQTDVVFLADDLIPLEPSPSKRRQMAQSICFAKWLIGRGVVNDQDGAE